MTAAELFESEQDKNACLLKVFIRLLFVNNNGFDRHFPQNTR